MKDDRSVPPKKPTKKEIAAARKLRAEHDPTVAQDHPLVALDLLPMRWTGKDGSGTEPLYQALAARFGCTREQVDEARSVLERVSSALITNAPEAWENVHKMALVGQQLAGARPADATGYKVMMVFKVCANLFGGELAIGPWLPRELSEFDGAFASLTLDQAKFALANAKSVDELFVAIVGLDHVRAFGWNKSQAKRNLGTTKNRYKQYL